MSFRNGDQPPVKLAAVQGFDAKRQNAQPPGCCRIALVSEALRLPGPPARSACQVQKFGDEFRHGAVLLPSPARPSNGKQRA